MFDVEFDNFENGDNRFFLQYGINAESVPIIYWNTSSRLSLALYRKCEEEMKKYGIDKDRLLTEMHKAVKAQIIAKCGDPYVQLHFNIQTGNWTEDDKAHALSPASISMWLGNEMDFSKSVLRTMHKAMQMEAVIDEEAA